MPWTNLFKSNIEHKYPLKKPVLGEPLPVSAFIRFTRWTLLFSGIGFGVWRWGYLKRKETAHRECLRKQKLIWDEEQRILKMKNNRAELLLLAEQTGNPIPPNFDELYPEIK